MDIFIKNGILKGNKQSDEKKSKEKSESIEKEEKQPKPE